MNKKIAEEMKSMTDVEVKEIIDNLNDCIRSWRNYEKGSVALEIAEIADFGEARDFQEFRLDLFDEIEKLAKEKPEEVAAYIRRYSEIAPEYVEITPEIAPLRVLCWIATEVGNGSVTWECTIRGIDYED